MKKKLKIAAIFFAAFIVVLLILPFALPQSLYKNWFQSQIESNLNLKLNVQTFRLAILPLPSLTLKNVQIFSTQAPFENQWIAQSGEISAYVQLKPLMDRQVIASLSLEEPVLYFRTSKEASNFSNLLVKNEKSDGGPTGWRLRVSSFELKKGELQYFSDSRETPKYTLKNVDIALKNLSLAGKSSIPLKISMSVLGGEDNFVLNGDVRLDLDTKQIVTDNLTWNLGRIAAKLKGNFDADKMTANMTLRADVAKLNGNTLAGDFPKIYEQVLHTSASEIPGFSNLGLDGTLQWTPKGFFTQGTLRAGSMQYKNYPLENVRCNFGFSPPRLNISSLSAAVFGANASANGFVLFINPLAYQFDFNLKNVDLTRLAFLKKQVVGKGVLNASLQGKIAANKGPLRDLNAAGTILVTEGSIPSLKLGEEIFGSSVWNILVPLAGFNKRALDNLKSLDATVEQLSIPFAIQGGAAKIINGSWQNPRYQIRLSGLIGFDESLSGNGAFLLSAKETEALIGDAGVRKALADPQGKLELPFNVSGTFENPKIDPDKKILTGRFTKVVALRGIDFVKDQLNPENIAKDPVNAIEAPINILKGIFGK
ncbi:MAG: AsmA family protein [Deltaproteobacteria bacterium]|nr:AsmA family protein [Deltaproteobacteria bacterium]